MIGHLAGRKLVGQRLTANERQETLIPENRIDVYSRLPNRIAAKAGSLVVRNRSSRLIPKRIEVKPIVRREPGIMFQTIDVALSPMLNVFGAMVAT
jgi:hypothetical protein